MVEQKSNKRIFHLISYIFLVCIIILLSFLYINIRTKNNNLEKENRDLSESLLKTNLKIIEFEYSKNKLYKTTWILNSQPLKESQPVKIELLDEPYLTFNRDNHKTYKYKEYKIDNDKLLITGWTNFTDVYNIINDSLIRFENLTYNRIK